MTPPNRFRFRAWHSYEGMTHDVVMGSKGFTATWKGQGGLRIGQEFYAERQDAILMQSTGLLDRNQREIFEGDLLQISYKDGRISMVGQVKFGDHRTSTDYYASSAFGWYVEDVRGGYDSEYSIVQTFGDFQEIIGNCYENPELLK